MYVHSNQLIVTQRSYDTTLVSRNDQGEVLSQTGNSKKKLVYQTT